MHAGAPCRVPTRPRAHLALPACARHTLQLYTNASFSGQFAAFWAAVASAYAPLGGDALVGYEVLNEPWAGDVLANPALLVPGVADRANLQPFYEQVARAIRAVAPNGVLLFEGVTWDDFFPLGFDALPNAADGLAAVSYHFYDLPGLDFEADIAQRAADMTRLQAGGLLTEFAVYPDGFCPDSLDCMRDTLDTLERYSHGYIGWEYASMWDNATALSEPRAYELARPFPMAVAGHLTGVAFDRNASTMTVNFTAPPTPGGGAAWANATVVFVSLGLYFPGGVTASLAAAPADARAVLTTPCWAGAGAGGARVDPPAMGCAPPPAAPLTPGAPLPYAYGYVQLELESASGGAVSLVITGQPK